MGHVRSFIGAVGLTAILAAQAAGSTAVTVPGDAGWVATGIGVSKGQALSVQTLGQVLTAPIPQFHVPGDFKSASGPEGQTSNATCGETYATFPDALKPLTGPRELGRVSTSGPSLHERRRPPRRDRFDSAGPDR
jgi:hypothetical protein